MKKKTGRKTRDAHFVEAMEDFHSAKVDWYHFIFKMLYHSTIAYFVGIFFADVWEFIALKHFSVLSDGGTEIGRMLGLSVVLMYWITQMFGKIPLKVKKREEISDGEKE